MSAWTAAALAIAVTTIMAGTTANAACVSKSSSRCADAGLPVNLSSVPDIAKQIVSEEPTSQAQTKPLAEPAPAAPYTGPIFGATSGKRIPTVGYSWSLE